MKAKPSAATPSDDILDRLWTEVINLPQGGQWLDDFIGGRRAGSHPIPKVKEAMKRLVASSVSKEDLGRVGRAERYEMCFRVLYSLDDPGLKSGKLAGLHKALADAKPGIKGKAACEKPFFKSLWEDINADDDGEFCAEHAKQPATDAPFGDTSPALKRLLEQGATAGDLGRLAAWHRHEACHDALQILAECFEEAEDTFGLHESILMADPSGMEGRPGSWPVTTKPAPKQKSTVQRQSSSDPTVPCFIIPEIEDCDANAHGDVFIAWSNSDFGSPVRVHDITTGEQLSVLKETKDFYNVEMLNDGKRVVASLDRSLAIIDVASGKKVVETRWKWLGMPLEAGKDLLVCATEWDKAGNERETYNLFDLATLKRSKAIEFKEAAGKLQAIRFAADGHHLALLVLPAQADNYRMTIWSWPEAVCIGQWDTPYLPFAWAPDGSWMAVPKQDELVVVEPVTGKVVWSTGVKHHTLAASPDGRWLVSTDGKGAISIWSIHEKRKVREISTGEKVIHGLGIFPENRLMVACCDERCVFWDFKRLVQG